MKLLELWRKSFPFRLSLALSFAFTLLVTSWGGAVFLIVSNGLYGTVDDGLLRVVRAASQLHGVEEIIEHGDDRESKREEWHEIEEAWHELAGFTGQSRDTVLFQIVDDRGHLISQSGRLNGHVIPLLHSLQGVEFATVLPILLESGRVKTQEPAGKWYWLPPEGSVRAVYLPLGEANDTQYVLVGAVSTEPIRSVLSQLLKGMVASLLLAFLLINLVSTYFAWQAFKPIKTVTNTAEAIDAASLETRIQAEVRDITLQRLVEVLNRMLERLQKAFQARRNFLDNASHELRTPLTSLRAELELALERPRTNQELRNAISRALEEVDHLIELSEALLLLSKSGKLPDERVNVPLQPMVLRVIKRLEAKAHSVGVSIEPDIPGELSLYGDPHALESMLGNLVQNAIEACQKGCTVRIRAEAKRRDGKQGVALRVVDNGAGMPGDIKEKIFERFYQAKRDDQGGHAGLGLAIVQEIVTAHRGQIEVESEQGKGTHIQVWLPESSV